MIIYTTQQHHLLSAIIQTITNSNCYYYHKGHFKISEVNKHIPNIINKFDLNSTEKNRENNLRKGWPTYTLIINFHPKDIGYISFYLFSTGYRSTSRAAQGIKENWQALNLKMMRERGFKSVITQNPNDLIRIGDFVLRQYIKFPELVPGKDYQYLFPETYGVLIDPRTFDSDAERLSIQALSHVKDAEIIQLGTGLDSKEAEKFKQASARFAEVFLRDPKINQTKTHAQLKALLRKDHGIVLT